ncbi:MAG: nitroreductase [Hyphomonadaceae bacterium]|nr:nitroreductase [Hyphomonadaceae bacterium]
MNVDEALRARISIRAYKPDPVPEALVRDILDVARYAPSGGNLQPWRVIAVAGAARQAVIELARTHLPGDAGDRFIYPADLWEPYRSRRFKVGEDMYALLGVPRDNKPGRLMQFARNYEFFGAPIGLFFVIDERMGYGQWAHMGMFMQSVALAAQARGLSTCMQEAWAMLRQPLHAHFGLGEHEMIYAGMALGYADMSAPVNTLRSARASVDEIAEFKGF